CLGAAAAARPRGAGAAAPGAIIGGRGGGRARRQPGRRQEPPHAGAQTLARIPGRPLRGELTMTPSQALISENASDSLLADLIEEVTDKLQAGKSVDWQVYLDRYPERAEELRQ